MASVLIKIIVTKFTVYSLLYAYKKLGQGIGGGIAVCKPAICFKVQISITVFVSVSDKGFNIKLIYFVIKQLITDV
jgi:hypothetical protein